MSTSSDESFNERINDNHMRDTAAILRASSTFESLNWEPPKLPEDHFFDYSHSNRSTIIVPPTNTITHEISLIGNEQLCSKEAILNKEISQQILSVLPTRFRLSPCWRLVYSSYMHGFSLNTLYNKCRDTGPSIMAIRDSDDNLFGIFATENWHPSPNHYGTGETFLYKILDDSSLKVFNSTGKNEYYMLGDTHFLAAGCSNGRFGLWLDDELYYGATSNVTTFNNDELTCSNFKCTSLEIYTIA